MFSSPFNSDLLRDFLLFLELFKFASEVESRTQGSRPKTQNKSEAKAKDSPSEDRHSQGQGEECSGPRPMANDTNASDLFWRSPNIFFKRSRSSKQFVRRSPQKDGLEKNFSAGLEDFNHPKNSAVLEPRTGNFREHKASRPGPRT